MSAICVKTVKQICSGRKCTGYITVHAATFWKVNDELLVLITMH